MDATRDASEVTGNEAHECDCDKGAKTPAEATENDLKEAGHSLTATMTNQTTKTTTTGMDNQKTNSR